MGLGDGAVGAVGARGGRIGRKSEADRPEH